MKGNAVVWVVAGLGVAVAGLVAWRTFGARKAAAPVAPVPVAAPPKPAPKGVAEQVASYVGLGLNLYGQGHSNGLW